jgi:DNA repair exonuclease SbcCD ATPase subunit
MIQITKLEVQGLRSFGAKPQTLSFSSKLAVVYGANSNGKSSLAEAVEFLLTGQIVRRELMASGQDEFADALRNAHLPAGAASYVEAEIIGADGKPHTIRRTLKTDYGKKQDCESDLQIDGKAATESGFSALAVA